jgi:hypothetical protein
MHDPAHGREEGGSIAAAWSGCQTPARPPRGEGGPRSCGSADRAGHAPDSPRMAEPSALRRRIHALGGRRGDRGSSRFGTPLDRGSIRNEVVLAKWLGKPTCEHPNTQSRLGWREHAALSISTENSRAISSRSPTPTLRPRIRNRPACAWLDLKPQRSSTLGIAREGRACDLVVTRLEASPLGRGAVVRAANRFTRTRNFCCSAGGTRCPHGWPE